MRTEVLYREVQRKGGAKAVAAALEVSPAAIYYYISGDRVPSSKLLDYLGLKRVEKLVRA